MPDERSAGCVSVCDNRRVYQFGSGRVRRVFSVFSCFTVRLNVGGVITIWFYFMIIS